FRIGAIVNTMVDQLNAFASEVSRVAREVGTEGKLGGQAQVPGVAGTWKDLTDNVNLMAANLTGQVRNIAEVTTAVAKGDLSKKIAVDVKGEILELKSTINTMVDQLNAFASEVSRVAREVGTDGKLGGQAQVPGVAGTWKDLTDNVNSMAANLTNQVRGIANVVTAVANGDLNHKLVFGAKGEIAALADTINGMIDTLATFADQVTDVAREVGIEGKLGGQAKVPGAAGLWRGLTDNVNQLAANLTTQVRAIAEVATAVAQGDLTRSIMVNAQGEVAALKDNINEMIRNLAGTTRKNMEQDWLKTNLANFSRTLQGHRDLVAVSKLILTELAPLVKAQQGVVYTQNVENDAPRLDLVATYACKPGKNLPTTLGYHENLIGQCAFEKKRILLNDVPADYIPVRSGLGAATPQSVVIMPVLFEGEVKAVIELASLQHFNEAHLSFLEQLTESIGIVFNTIEATMRTEHLLTQSQSLTGELQSQQEELKKTNDRLEQQADSLQQSESLLKKQQEELQRTNQQLQENAKQLSEQMKQVEYKNKEVELAKAALEEKAEQLSLSSRYKSEFLANMSHELRTPLNSLLILAQLLAENPASNLTPKQIEYAQTIYTAGNDLLALINDVLDLAKVESGTVTLNIATERFPELQDYVDRAFRQVAHDKGVEFRISMDRNLPLAIRTDAKRLRQILKNLLSNAFKFTPKGSVSLEVAMVASGWTPGHALLDDAGPVVAFSVTDTGIGIPPEKQQIIFEAFQQADGTTSRQFGGTGLGLSISSELTRLLGGDIKVQSSPGKGSTFTLYLPLVQKAEGDTDNTAPTLRTDQKRPPVPARSGRSRRPRVDGSAALVAVRQDDLGNVRPGDRVVLVVEEDRAFASKLLDLVHESGFKGLIASNADDALALAKEISPDAIMLDTNLPGMDGWDLLDLFKQDPTTRHIPVNVISMDDRKQECMWMGAVGFVQKASRKETVREALSRLRGFMERDPGTLLVAAGNKSQREAIAKAVATEHLQVTTVSSGKQALEVLDGAEIDCMMIGQSLTDMAPIELVRGLVQKGHVGQVPIAIHTAEDAAAGQNGPGELAELLVLKRVPSAQAVLDETTLFLQNASRDVPSAQHSPPSSTGKALPDLAGRRVLLVDDDIRNIFALTSALEQQGMIVMNAENGVDGIEMLKKNPEIDIILMDMMMPELDGYDTIRVMRGLERFRDVPIIGVSAKAMKGDREKCIEAGASDYISKPVNLEQLLSLIRGWLVKTSADADA
ncbi:MAG TPA: response regulator, partial [Burkholderiales bacterium]|nr:response regulator [Burkholderiales bacterium]